MIVRWRRMMWVAMALVLGTFVAADAHGGQFAMSGQGTAAFKAKKDSEPARRDAEREAIADALRKALAKKLTREQAQQYAAQIETDVLPVAMTYVTRHQIVDQQERDKVWTVTVKAFFDDDTLAANLDAIGFSQDVGSRRTVAVLIDEFFSNDLPPRNEPLVAKEMVTYSVDASSSREVDASASSSTRAAADRQSSGSASYSAGGGSAGYGGASGYAASGSAAGQSSASASYDSSRDAAYSERQNSAYNAFFQSVKEYFPPDVVKTPRNDPASAAAIAEQLLQRDVRLADRSTVSKVREGLVGPDGLLMSVVADPATLSVRAMKLGSMNGVDAMMTGTTAIVYNGERGGRHSATASLAIKIVDSATGDIVASATTQATGLGANSEAAATAAAQRLGASIGMTLGDQLFQYWKKRDEKGIELSLRFVGITSTRTNLALEDALRNVQGTEDVMQRAFDRTSGLAEFVVTTRRPINEYRSDMLRALYGVPDFANLEEETSIGTNLNFTVR